jgi:hypothetical protein
MKVPVQGGNPVKLSELSGLRPEISPDGNWIAAWLREPKDDPTWRLGLIPTSGNGAVKFFEVAPTVSISWDALIRWTADGQNLTYIDHRGGVENVWGQSIDGGPAKQLTNFKDSRIFSFDWSREGRLLASRGVQTNDVVLISDAK